MFVFSYISYQLRYPQSTVCFHTRPQCHVQDIFFVENKIEHFVSIYIRVLLGFVFAAFTFSLQFAQKLFFPVFFFSSFRFAFVWQWIKLIRIKFVFESFMRMRAYSRINISFKVIAYKSYTDTPHER